LYIGCNLNLSNSDKFRWNKIDDLVSFDVEEVDEVFKVDEVGSATFDEVEFMFSDTSILIVDDLKISPSLFITSQRTQAFGEGF